jgi:hypothetical protein
MSVSFYGLKADNEPIMLDFEHAAHLNLATRMFLSFLGFEPGEGPDGEATIPDARRAIMRARATFDRRVSNFTREGSDTKRPGQLRVIEGGLGEDYHARRLDDFERFINTITEMGAVSFYWT